MESPERNLGGWIAVVLEAHKIEGRDPQAAERLYREGIERYPESASLLGYYATFLRDSKAEYEQAEHYYLRALQLDPNDAENLGSYAVFLNLIRKDYDQAEVFYQRCLQANPYHSSYLASYALLLEEVRKDFDRAEEYHQRAVDADPNNANHLGNFALFLELAREDYDRAEKYYQQAVQADRRHPNNLANYAVFLQQARKDHVQAEEFYRRAVEADPKNANYLGNYASLVLSRGELLEGYRLLDDLLAMLPNPNYAAMEAEAWFYAYAHWPRDKRARALKELKRVLTSGVRSPDWDFSLNIVRARQERHPDIEWLQVLADVITKEADIARLEEWEEWRNC